MLKTALLLVSALGIGTASYADSTSVRYGQGSCSYNTDQDTGKSLEFYGDTTDTDDLTIGFRYVIEFQKPKPAVDPCHAINRISARAMQVDLETAELELEMLRLRVEAAKRAVTVTEDKPREIQDLGTEW